MDMYLCLNSLFYTQIYFLHNNPHITHTNCTHNFTVLHTLFYTSLHTFFLTYLTFYTHTHCDIENQTDKLACKGLVSKVLEVSLLW